MKKYSKNARKEGLRIMLFSILMISFGAISCSDDEVNTTTELPGTITVSAASITGQSGKVLVITASRKSVV